MFTKMDLFFFQGAIYMLNSSQSDVIVKVLDVLSRNFVSAAFLSNKENTCVVKKRIDALINLQSCVNL